MGAGASADSGAPLVNDFLDKAWVLWKTNIVPERSRKSFNLVFGAIGELQKVHSKSKLDLNNLESVFSIFEMSSYLDHNFKEPGENFGVRHASEFVKALKEVIIVTLEQSIIFPLEHGRIISTNAYGAFAKLVKKLLSEADPKHKISIVSFNYDLALEVALFTEGVNYEYGLQNSRTFYDHALKVSLHKLHGSLNWATSSQVETIVPWDMGSFFYNRIWRHGTLEIGSNIVKEGFRHIDNVLNEVFLVPPTFNKTFNNDEIRSIWKKSANALSEADNLFVIGFSMPETDLFFKYLYALGTVGSDMFRRFWVFDPKEIMGEVDKKYRDLLGPGAESRYRYYQMNFASAVKRLTNTFK